MRRGRRPLGRHALVCVAALTAALALAPLARGGEVTAADRAVADALFRDGRNAAAAKDWPTACIKFAESQRLDPKLGTLLYLATCHEQEGKLASAWVEFTEARALATRSNQPDRERIAKERAQSLEPRLTKLLVTVEAQAEGLQLTLDKTALSPAVFGSPFPVDAGEHLLVATAPDREPLTLSVTAQGEGATIKVVVPRLREKIVEVPVSTPAPPPPPPPRNDRTLAYVAGGVGLAGLAVGSVFGAMALGKDSDANGFCNGKTCSQAGLDLHDEARTMAHVSTVGLVVGAIGVGVATYLFLKPEPKRAAAIGPLEPVRWHGGRVAVPTREIAR